MGASKEQINKAIEVVEYYTVTASATGAFPVPAASAAVIAENGIMLSHIACALGAKIDVQSVVSSIGIAGSLNIVGRNVFIEGAKLLSWGTGSIWAAAALSALGASTAGLQTYIIGRIAIEIGKDHGDPINTKKASKIIDEAKSNYNSFINCGKQKIPKPE